MNQHISSMLEHFSALRRKNSETPQVPSSSEKITSLLADEDQKEVSDVESMSSKTKSIFKELISDSGATNTILQNCTNFIKCTGTISHLNTSASPSASSSSATNGTYKTQKKDNHDGACDSNRKQEVKTIFNLHESSATNNITATNEQGRENINNGTSSKKRNSIAPNGDLSLLRELSPSPRSHRKSSYDSRMLKASADEDIGRHSNTIMRPLKTRNITTRNETFDTLHYRAMDVSIDLKSCYALVPLIFFIVNGKVRCL